MASDDAERGGDVAPKTNIPLSASATIGSTIIEIFASVDGTTVEDGGTQSDGPYDNAA